VGQLGQLLGQLVYTAVREPRGYGAATVDELYSMLRYCWLPVFVSIGGFVFLMSNYAFDLVSLIGAQSRVSTYLVMAVTREISPFCTGMAQGSPPEDVLRDRGSCTNLTTSHRQNMCESRRCPRRTPRLTTDLGASPQASCACFGATSYDRTRHVRQPEQVGRVGGSVCRTGEPRAAAAPQDHRRGAGVHTSQLHLVRGLRGGGEPERVRELLGSLQVRLLELQPGDVLDLDHRVDGAARVLTAQRTLLAVQVAVSSVMVDNHCLGPSRYSEDIVSYDENVCQEVLKNSSEMKAAV